MPVLSKTVDQAAKAWTKQFAAAVRAAAGESERLTPKKAGEMSGPYADNAVNYFQKTGKSWSNVDKVIESGAKYIRAQAEKAAGADGKLSLTDIRKMNADVSNDMLILRGKAPAQPAPAPNGLQGLKDAVDRAGNIPEISDYNKNFSVSNEPASKSREDILRDIVGYDDLSDSEVSDWFSSTKGAAAVADFAGAVRDIGQEQFDNATDDPGSTSPAALQKAFTDVAAGAEATFLPLSQFKSVEYLEHTIAEDGDTEHRLLLAKKQDDSWLLLSYYDFPF